MMTAEEYAKLSDLNGLGKRVGDLEGDVKVITHDVSGLKEDIRCLPNMATQLALQGQTLGRIVSNMNKLIWLLIAEIIGIGGAIIVAFVTGKV